MSVTRICVGIFTYRGISIIILSFIHYIHDVFASFVCFRLWNKSAIVVSADRMFTEKGNDWSIITNFPAMRFSYDRQVLFLLLSGFSEIVWI